MIANSGKCARRLRVISGKFLPGKEDEQLRQVASQAGAVIPAVEFPPAPEILRPIHAPFKRLFGPGPTNIAARVVGAGAQPMVGHLQPEFYQIMEEIKVGLKYAFQTENEMTVALSAAGHGAMEASLMNVLEPGDVVLIGVNGMWAGRMVEIASRTGADVRTMNKQPNEVFNLGDIEEALKTHKPVLLFLTHGESSGGVCQPLEGVGDLCHQHDCMLLVDTVASLGGAPFLMDKWNIDIAYSGSQKCLSAPPGIAPISFGDRARQKMKNRKSKCPSFYFDMNLVSNYWAVPGFGDRTYHYTAALSGLYALRESLMILAENGLEKTWTEHRSKVKELRTGLQNLGLTLYIKDEEEWLPTVTSILVPPTLDWKQVAVYIMEKYHIEVAGGMGWTLGKVWRIGIMGHNCSSENVKVVLDAMKDALNHFGFRGDA